MHCRNIKRREHTPDGQINMKYPVIISRIKVKPLDEIFQRDLC